MRNLTIKRNKRFSACLAKFKIYVEDYENPDLAIGEVPCRKLGDIKNGEEKTFTVDNGSVKVFVIADLASKDYCNEFYQLPEGEDDVYLSGQASGSYSTSLGTPFVFDGNETPEVLEHRRRGKKKGTIVLITAIIVGFAIGFVSSYTSIPRDKVFTCEGMSITLTNKFNTFENEYYTEVYDSRDAAVMVLREGFDLFEGLDELSVKEYAEAVAEGNELSAGDVKTGNGLTWFEYDYTDTETNDEYRYYAYAYKDTDAFWLIQFAVFSDEADEMKPKVEKWAASVTFED